MNAALAVVTDDAPEEYPIPLGERPPLKFLMYDHNRFLNSDLCCHDDLEVLGAEHKLQMRAVHQDPPGTLPECEVRQARLLGLGNDLERYRALRRRGLLQEWRVYACASLDGERAERRLGHPALRAALSGAVKSATVSEAGSDRMRLKRLRDALVKAGYGKRFVDDEANVEWVHKILLDRLPAGANRTVARVKEAADFVIARSAETPES